MTGFSTESFTFLRGLEDNNNRDWFNENKAKFAKHLEQPFADLLEALSNRLSDARRPLSGDKSTMFRMNRDVRFSKDKTLYKTNVSGMLTPSGSKSEVSSILYLHLQSGGGFAAAGYYNLSPKQLIPIRDAIEARSRLLGSPSEGWHLNRGPVPQQRTCWSARLLRPSLLRRWPTLALQKPRAIRA